MAKSYSWRVRVGDSDDWVAVENRSQCDWQPFTMAGTLEKTDSDGDGINDEDEVAYWGDDWNADIDGDGLINVLDPDSDGDGYKDGYEIDRGTDPADPGDTLRLSMPWVPLLLLND